MPNNPNFDSAFDFVRCYIENISPYYISFFQNECPVLDGWIFCWGPDFDYESSYGYQPGIWLADSTFIMAAKERSIIAENRSPATAKKSIIWNNALIISDVITLLGISQGHYISIVAIERKIGTKYSINRGLFTGDDQGYLGLVPLNRLNSFINDSIKFMEENTDWLQKSGFKPAIYWYIQAQISYLTSPTILAIGLYWISLEVMAKIYAEENGLRMTKKDKMIFRFLSDKVYTGPEWDFITEIVVNCYKIRNELFHEGTQSFDPPKITQLHKQLRDLMSYIFIDMLQKQDSKQVQKILQNIKNY